MKIDNQQAAVMSLCEQYLQNNKSAITLLNTLVVYAADMAMIDDKREDGEFAYLDGLEELIHAMKNMNHDMGLYNLLSMGDYHIALPSIPSGFYAAGKSSAD